MAAAILIAEERTGGKLKIAANEQWHNVTLRVFFSSATISLCLSATGSAVVPKLAPVISGRARNSTVPCYNSTLLSV